MKDVFFNCVVAGFILSLASAFGLFDCRTVSAEVTAHPSSNKAACHFVWHVPLGSTRDVKPGLATWHHALSNSHGIITRDVPDVQELVNEANLCVGLSDGTFEHEDAMSLGMNKGVCSFMIRQQVDSMQMVTRVFTGCGDTSHRYRCLFSDDHGAEMCRLMLESATVYHVETT